MSSYYYLETADGSDCGCCYCCCYCCYCCRQNRLDQDVDDGVGVGIR